MDDGKINSMPDMTRIVERNIKALPKQHKKEEQHKTPGEKLTDDVTRFTGSMLFVNLHLVLFGVWICWSTCLLGLKSFDPSLVILAMFASGEAIFFSTFVPISQNRMNARHINAQTRTCR